MRKRIKSGMTKFARELGAMRGKRPDWYLVAEHLAGIARPDLLDSPSNKGPGAPGIDWTMLFFDVDLVMRQKRCTITEACKELCRGYLPYCSTVTFLDGRKASLCS